MGKKKKTMQDEMRDMAISLGLDASYVDDVFEDVKFMNELFEENNVDRVATVGEVREIAKTGEEVLVVCHKYDEFRDHAICMIEDYEEREYSINFEWDGYSCWYDKCPDDTEFKKLGDGKWSWSVYKLKK